MLKKLTVIFAVLAFVGFAVSANANVSTIKSGGTGVCENASWVVYNLSETKETKITFDLGPHAYAWKKIWKKTLPPGGFVTAAIHPRSTIVNKGPGAIQMNCQRKRYDSHDWKVDQGAGMTYQPNYHLDHVKPGTYIEPGMGQPEGTEGRGLFGGVSSQQPEWQR